MELKSAGLELSFRRIHKLNNLSQLDDHYTDYLDNNPDVEESEIYNLLIINHQRKHPTEKREPVNPEIIDKAKGKYGILIIETVQLLDLFEKHTKNEIDRDETIELFKGVGLFSMK